MDGERKEGEKGEMERWSDGEEKEGEKDEMEGCR